MLGSLSRREPFRNYLNNGNGHHPPLSRRRSSNRGLEASSSASAVVPPSITCTSHVTNGNVTRSSVHNISEKMSNFFNTKRLKNENKIF